MQIQLHQNKAIKKQQKTNKPEKTFEVVQLADVIKRKKQAGRWNKVELTWLKYQIQSVLDGKKAGLGPFNNILNAWKNEPAFVVGGSYGLKNAMKEGFSLQMLNGFHSIGINHIIEDYHNFEWFVVQDARFFEWTTYDMSKYQGRIFADVKTRLKPDENVTIFYTQEEDPTLNMIDGLYSYESTGLLALHLAIISGASPIYMMGLDNGGKIDSKKGAHYKKNYPHEVKAHPNWAPKYKNRVPEKCKAYKKFSNTIYNVDPKGDIEVFPKIGFRQIKEFKKKRIEINQNLKICHIGTLPISKMGDITRHVFEKSIGNHKYCNINKKPPKANIYILECFKNNYEKFRNFKKPEGSQVISLIHSSYPCIQAKCSDKIVTLTHYWQDKLKDKGIESQVIPGAIEKFAIKKDYSSMMFGRITRNVPGKFHPKWNQVVEKVLNKYEDAKLLIYCNNSKGLYKHKRAIYDHSIKINQVYAKQKALSQMTVAVFAHGKFEEIFPMGILECMSVGLPIICISQPSMNEMIGQTQLIVENITEVEQALIELLPDTERKKELGRKAQIRAKRYSIGKMIEKWNILLRSLSWK